MQDISSGFFKKMTYYILSYYVRIFTFLYDKFFGILNFYLSFYGRLPLRMLSFEENTFNQCIFFFLNYINK